MIKFSELKNQARIPLKDAIPLSAPFTIFIEPTNLCTFRCTMCPHSLKDYAKQAGYHQLMPITLYRKVIADIAALGGCKSLCLWFDGEPLIHPDIGEMLKLGRTVTQRLTLTTNASLLTEDRAQEIIDAEVDYVKVSIYGISQKAHERTTGNKNEKFSVDHIRNNVFRLRIMRDEQNKKRPYIAANMLARDEWQEFVDRYKNVADEVVPINLVSWGSDLISVSVVTGQIKACPHPFYTLVVRANGEIVPCAVAWSRDLIIGDVNKETLSEIWNGEKMKSLREMHLAGRRNEVSGCIGCTNLFESKPIDSVDSVTVEEYNRRLKGTS